MNLKQRHMTDQSESSNPCAPLKSPAGQRLARQWTGNFKPKLSLSVTPTATARVNGTAVMMT